MLVYKARQLRRLIFIVLISLPLLLVFLSFRNTLIDDIDRKARLQKIDEVIKTQANKLACKQPNLPVHSPEIMKFVHEVPNIDCSSSGEDWVKCKGFDCTISENVKYKYGNINCAFTDILREDDYKLSNGETTNSDSYYRLQASDVVRANCKSKYRKWSATLTGIREDKKVLEESDWESLPPEAAKVNVIMMGFDSLSRNSFIRKLPKSYEYLTQIMDSQVLQGYNIVGDGTPQALIPILTGKTELELPDTRKRLKDTKFVNEYPFIWNDYKEAGYVTGFFEDIPELGTFTYRLNGFKDPPTDHYMRPYYLASLSERRKYPKLCTGDSPRHQIFFNQIQNYFSAYKDIPKFLFAFHGELSHDDYNLIGTADGDLLNLLKDLNNKGYFNDTIFILMADHGHRFAEIRNTIQGKQEERLPFFSFAFPSWFKQKYKNAYRNFQNNLDKLTTPFDIYETLKNVLNMNEVGIADITKRSVSLFSKIPAERSCAHAYIEPHWCACLDWKSVNVSDPIVEVLAKLVVDTLNQYTAMHRELCEVLYISQIFWVSKMTPNDKLLKFNKNMDMDGFVADLSAKMSLREDMYQIKVMLTPGNSLFEASIKHNLITDKMELKMTDISRINMYGRQARCVENDFPELRKYCYCKND